MLYISEDLVKSRKLHAGNIIKELAVPSRVVAADSPSLLLPEALC
jgi:hypothetical protein